MNASGQNLLSDYDPPQGAHLVAKDPIRFGGGQANLYVYVGGDPINRTDPSGLATICIYNRNVDYWLNVLADFNHTWIHLFPDDPSALRPYAGWDSLGGLRIGGYATDESRLAPLCGGEDQAAADTPENAEDEPVCFSTTDEVIERVIEGLRSYEDEEYGLFPDPGDSYHNCNSLTAALLACINVGFPWPNNEHPGWDNPVPLPACQVCWQPHEG